MDTDARLWYHLGMVRSAPCNNIWACWDCRKTAKLSYEGGRCPCGREMLRMYPGWKPGKKGSWPIGLGERRGSRDRIRMGTGTFADGVTR